MKAILRHEEWKNEPKFITLSHDLRHIKRYIGQNTVPFEAKQEVIQVISAPDMTQNATKFHVISSRFFYDFIYPFDSQSISKQAQNSRISKQKTPRSE